MWSPVAGNVSPPTKGVGRPLQVDKQIEPGIASIPVASRHLGNACVREYAFFLYYGVQPRTGHLGPILLEAGRPLNLKTIISL